MVEDKDISHSPHAFSARLRRTTFTRLAFSAVGCLLIIASFLKASTPTESARLQTAYNLPPEIFSAVHLIELALGLALLFGLRSRLVWQLAVAVFAAFSGFSLYRGLAGFESCGCFGTLRINPWWTFGLDVAVLSALVVNRRYFGEEGSPGRWNRNVVFTSSFAILAAALVTLWLRSEPTTLGSPSTGSLVILEPETWIGKQFPLKQHLSPSTDTASGEWIVLMYHHDCPKCQDALPAYESLADKIAADDRNVLLVETPPYGEPPTGSKKALHARLTTTYEWFIQTPHEIQIVDGIVRHASLQLPSVAPIP